MGRAARQRTDGPDTDLGVVHQRGKRPVPAAPPELVNNSAAGHGARSARKTRPATLRALCRDEITLIEQRTALVNQLLAALSEYYPAALEIFEDWTRPFAWALIQQLPTPLALQNAGKRQWEKFRHPPALVAHRHRPRPARTLCTRQRPVRQRRRDPRPKPLGHQSGQSAANPRSPTPGIPPPQHRSFHRASRPRHLRLAARGGPEARPAAAERNWAGSAPSIPPPTPSAARPGSAR